MKRLVKCKNAVGKFVENLTGITKLDLDRFGVSFDEVYYSEEERTSGKHAQSTVTFDASKANIHVPPYRGGLADRLAEAILNEKDDEIMQMREDMRRNPELRVLYDLQRKATKQELRQMEAFIRAIRSGNETDE